LSEQGLLRVVRGRGMFARELPIAYHIGPETRFSANLAAQDLVPNRRVLERRLARPLSWRPNCSG
jgi:DNA-binding GntR family transcriptional regulator